MQCIILCPHTVMHLIRVARLIGLFGVRRVTAAAAAKEEDFAHVRGLRIWRDYVVGIEERIDN